MMTQQPLFPLADPPDVDLEQAAARTWPWRDVHRSGADPARQARPGPRSRRRSTSCLVYPTLALHVLLAVISTSHVRNVPSRESTGLMAGLTGIVIVRVYACGDIGHATWPAGFGCNGLAFDQLDLERARVGRSERIALRMPAPQISSTRLESPRERR